MSPPALFEVQCPSPHEVPDPAAVAGAVEQRGAAITRALAGPAQVAALESALARALDEDTQRYGPDHRFPGIVHALAARGPAFLELLESPGARAVMRALLGHGCIVHGYNSTSVPPRGCSYAASIHVDAPRFVPGYITNVGFVLALNAFTSENGGMEIWPESFRLREAPVKAQFQAEAMRLTLAPGDAVFFNARCWHRAGLNQTDAWRHAVSLNVCRSYMRQQFDFPRLLDAAGVAPASPELRQFLGYFVRMPTGMDEFLLPPDERPYRPGQE